MKTRIGVLGAGHLGSIHLQQIAEIGEFALVGFYDPDPEKCEIATHRFGIKAFESVEALIEACEAVDIVTPTLSHFDCAVKSIRRSRHVFIEKPLTNTVSEAEALLSLAAEAQVIGQVGHVERFNPAFLAALKYVDKPKFMEVHRLAQFNPRGTDVPVVLDLMIHDIDIVLSVVKSGVRSIHASGVPVISTTPDIANARIEFDNGAVANLTASRVSLKKMRKARFFQRDGYLSVDFLDKKVEAIRLSDGDLSNSPFQFEIDPLNDGHKKTLSYESPAVAPINAIKYELELFAKSIQGNLAPAVSLEEGYQSLRVAHEILQKIEQANAKF
ncbi:MAG: Gfo/Idh/MocA family oxidoreductase [Bacteroidetes bacterium]|nr:Gfo/Idh/MocA family oxidoreductase [Bacteroidota bacterium]